MVKEFNEAVLPANCSAVVIDTFHRRVIAEMFTDKERGSLARFHVAASLVLMAIMVRAPVAANHANPRAIAKALQQHDGDAHAELHTPHVAGWRRPSARGSRLSVPGVRVVC